MITPCIKIAPISCAKNWLRLIVEIKKNKGNGILTYINEGTLRKSLWRDTQRYVVQSRSTDSISIAVEPHNLEFIITFVLWITKDVNTLDGHNLYSLKKNFSKNKNEAIDKLIIPCLMTAIVEAQDSKVRTSKRVTFGWLEIPAKSMRISRGCLVIEVILSTLNRTVAIIIHYIGIYFWIIYCL